MFSVIFQHPEYFNRVTCPISLNDIKRRLINEKSYESINDVIQDIKLVFSNAISYYYVSVINNIN